MKCHGKVVRQEFGAGSKSEHPAVMLLTPQGPLKLAGPAATRSGTPSWRSWWAGRLIARARSTRGNCC